MYLGSDFGHEMDLGTEHLAAAQNSKSSHDPEQQQPAPKSSLVDSDDDLLLCDLVGVGTTSDAAVSKSNSNKTHGSAKSQPNKLSAEEEADRKLAEDL